MSHRDNRWMEDEANYFALCVLIPENLLLHELKNVELDLTCDDALKYLARRFEVSLTAMAVRLADLGILGSKIKNK